MDFLQQTGALLVLTCVAMVAPGALIFALALSRYGAPKPLTEGAPTPTAVRIRQALLLEILGITAWLIPFAVLLTANAIELSVSRCTDSNLGCGYFLFGLMLSPFANVPPTYVVALGPLRALSPRRGPGLAALACVILFLPSTYVMVSVANAFAKSITD